MIFKLTSRFAILAILFVIVQEARSIDQNKAGALAQLSAKRGLGNDVKIKIDGGVAVVMPKPVLGPAVEQDEETTDLSGEGSSATDSQSDGTSEGTDQSDSTGEEDADGEAEEVDEANGG